ncbi:hypothetical protein KY342_04255 [Candidatus Woesearchaeota archaeon]|nr:hypothetical protein [Candidatus Woesearchaeota archaeon]
MEQYNHLMELFKDRGQFGTLPDDFGCYTIPFTPERIIGIAVHSLISHRPRDIYLTNGEEICLKKDKDQPKDLIDSQRIDILREDEMFHILCCQPPSTEEIYGVVDGHLRIAYFDLCFTDNVFDIYKDFLEKISKQLSAKQISINLIKQDEKNCINRRIKRECDRLTRLLSAMKQDESPLPKFAEKLEEKLKEYGF